MSNATRAVDEYALSFDSLLRAISNENAVLMESGAARNILTTQLRFEERLKRELTVAEQNLVQQYVAHNLELERQANLYDDIVGPTQQAQDQLRSLVLLFESGRISAEQYDQAVRDIRSQGATFGAQVAALAEENSLLRVNADERRALVAVAEIEADLRRTLTDNEEAYVRNLLARNTQLQAQADILEDLNSPLRNLESQLAALNDLYGENAITASQFNAAVEALSRQGLTFDDRLQALRQENNLLQQTELARRTQAEVLAAETELKRQLTGVERDLIEATLRENQQIEQQEDLYRSIVGPLEEANTALDNLRSLYDAGRISAGQFNQALDEFRAQGLTFDDRLAALQRENDLIGMSAQARNALNAILQIESGIKRDLTLIEQELVTAVIAENEELSRQAQLYESIVSPARDAQQQLGDLVDLLNQGVITFGQYSQAVDEVNNRGLTLGDQLNILERENALVVMSTQQRAINNRILQVESAIKRDLTQSERALIEALVQENQQLTLQQGVLTSITGPLRDVTMRLAALDALYQEGAISVGQYNQALDEVRRRGLTFDDRISVLQQENALVVMTTADRATYNTVLQAENALKRILTDTEREYIGQLVLENAELTRQASLYTSITGPLSDAQDQLGSLVSLLQQGVSRLRNTIRRWTRSRRVGSRSMIVLRVCSVRMTLFA